MEITWYGHSCFRITDRGQATVVCDPYDSEHVGYQPLKLKADIVTVSHESPSHSYLKGVKGEPYDHRPGEYEIGGMFITGCARTGNERLVRFPLLSDRLALTDHLGHGRCQLRQWKLSDQYISRWSVVE
jgi:hypothetical protein